MKLPECYRDLARAARSQGWVITRSGSGHLRWRSPAGTVVFTSGTPSDGRSRQTARAKLRRAGLAA